MKAHTSITQAHVEGRGRMKRRIVPADILALSLAVVLMAATASTASADVALYSWNCPPPPTPPPTFEQIPEGCLGAPHDDFGDQQVGTTSPAQRFALGVGCEPNVACNEIFTPRISVSDDYAQTNSCPPTLSAGAYPQIQGCLITVTFAPTGAGPKDGTLSTGPGGPTEVLTGTGAPVDHVPPDLRLSGPKRQDPQADEYCDRGRCDVEVRARCGDDWECTARATGKLTNVTKDKLSPVGPWVIDAGETVHLGPELAKEAQRREVRKALDNGKNVQAKVTVRAKDAAGDVATAKRTIKLVKHAPGGNEERPGRRGQR
jgi:hypothetical protein